jgi:hypothetical protein
MVMPSFIGRSYRRVRVAIDVRPQGGVDAIAAHFCSAKPVDGVRDNGDQMTRPVPTFGMTNGQAQSTGR